MYTQCIGVYSGTTVAMSAILFMHLLMLPNRKCIGIYSILELFRVFMNDPMYIHIAKYCIYVTMYCAIDIILMDAPQCSGSAKMEATANTFSKSVRFLPDHFSPGGFRPS